MAAAIALHGCWLLAVSDPGTQIVRVPIARWLTGYDGCICDQCGRMFLGISEPFGRSQMYVPLLGYGDPFWIGTIEVVYALSLVLLAAYGPALLGRLVIDRPDSCSACGYPRAGLAANAVCPECGAAPASGRPPDATVD